MAFREQRIHHPHLQMRKLRPRVINEEYFCHLHYGNVSAVLFRNQERLDREQKPNRQK